MTIVVAILLAVGVVAVWLGALAMLRLPALGRLHALAFINAAGGGAIALAVCVHGGATASSAKALLVWVVAMLAGALSTHVTGRAIHLRDGERV